MEIIKIGFDSLQQKDVKKIFQKIQEIEREKG